MDYLTYWTNWLIIGFLLLILELIIPSVFLMWWGLAAIATAAVVAFISLPLMWSIILFTTLAILFSLCWWRYQHQKDQADDKKSELNAREHYLIGSKGVVVEIVSQHIIRAKFGDSTWKVIGENLQLGDTVEVLNTEGITLLVRKI